MHIVMIGTGYVGLVTGACLAELGGRVTCVDKDSEKIEKLKQGIIPIYEPGLEAIVTRNYATKHLLFSDNLAEQVKQADVIFLAVGTPTSDTDGSADLSYVFKAVEEIAENLTKSCTIVTKSTVPVGTGAEIKRILHDIKPHIDCDVVSNPEFLREGSAVADFMEPDRLIVGAESPNARETMRRLYWNLIDRNVQILFTDIQTAELTKYASNAFLATRIAFINEMADICDKVGGNIDDLTKGMGMDTRIGARYLRPGPGFGGSCFPKDTRALSHTASQAGAPSRVVESVITSNDNRKHMMGQKVLDVLGEHLHTKTVGVLGTAFKANTDDMREAASLVIIPMLLEHGVTVRAYDPAAMENAKPLLPDDVLWQDSIDATCKDADIVVILTEWDDFRSLDFSHFSLKAQTVVDLRNLYTPATLGGQGIRYISIGRPDGSE